MKILEINYINFRNLADKNIRFSPKINLFLGKNGQGKTSIIEAVYFGATGKSFRTSKNSDMIKYGKLKTGCFLEYEDRISDKNLSVKIDSSKKEYRLNKKRVAYDEYYGKINVVSFIPEDIELIVGSPGVRRKFFDGEIAQSSQEYFQNLKQYTKLLKIRNKYLKNREHKDPMFSIYEDEFVKYGARVIKKRLEYVKNISIILNLNYRKLFDNKKELNLVYDSSIGEMGDIKKMSLEDLERRLREEIEKEFAKEIKYGYSMAGPQKDDFLFLLDGREAKSFSSQGEKKSIIFSLKLSEIDMVLKEKRENPIFLIDDVSSYFDSIRKESIINYLNKRDIQVIITSTDSLGIQSKNFFVEKGEIIEESEPAGKGENDERDS